MPELKLAELIDGIVYMPPPVTLKHGELDAGFQIVMASYASKIHGCECLSYLTWLMLDSAPQSDVSLCLAPEYGGRMTAVNDLASGAPELAGEITSSSRSYDLGPKLALYERAGVREYVTVLIEERRIEWRFLHEGSYRLMPPDGDGIFRSRVFPGLWLDSAAFWREDHARLLAALDEGLRSEEHARFLERLQWRT